MQKFVDTQPIVAAAFTLQQKLKNADDKTTVNRLVGAIFKLEDQIAKLEKRCNDYSWQVSPDRSGGAFSDAEINDTGWR